jgi:hypothetical protein
VNGEGFLFIVPCNELLPGQEPLCAISENLSIILSIIAYQAISTLVGMWQETE